MSAAGSDALPARRSGFGVTPVRKVLDLFSCIGGHALGLHATGGFETIQFVERDDYRRRVLAYHFPGVPIAADVTTFRASFGGVDVIIGGPPCQKTSNAAAIHGKRTGGSLWPEMRRIISDVGSAEWIVVEQPTASETWQTEVEDDLASLGYRTTRIILAASDFGAPHIRRRVFTLANASLSRLQVAGQARARTIERLSRGAFAGNPWRAGPPGSLRISSGVSNRLYGPSDLGTCVGGCDCACACHLAKEGMQSAVRHSMGGLPKSASALRRARIEAIGDSNPPIMMTAIGMMILEAS